MAFPNFQDKHHEDSIFTPKEFVAYRKKRGKYSNFKVPHGIILCYQRNLMEAIVKNHKVTKVDGLYGEMYLLDETNGKVVIIGNFGIGAPAATAVFEELIALGVKNFISIGFAGNLQKNTKIGDLIVCERAIRDEGISHHYIKSSKYAYASKEITGKIKSVLRKSQQEYAVGTSWTIDAFYRETVAEATKYQKEGVLTVEMEASALFAVAKYRSVQCGAIFIISDSLAELRWQPNFHLKGLYEKLETLYKVAVNVLSS